MDSANATKLVSLPSSGTGRNTLFCDGPLLALTISQPYASLIANGKKWVENRSWPTSYTGPLAIHAGRGTQYTTRADLTRYQTGKVIAVADLAACIYLHRTRLRANGSAVLAAIGIKVEQLLDHVYTGGPWCWILRNVRKLRVPVEIRGAQGLWQWHMSEPLELEPVAAEAVR